MGLNSDRAWEQYGAQNPYYGVLTDPRYLAHRLSDDAKTEFFNSGTQHILDLMSMIHRTIAPDFNPRRVLDFGCGVGRLAIPFAHASQEVVGVDVSESMLAEARRNATACAIDNVQFVRSDDSLSHVTGAFDLVHSYIVLQHIPVPRGLVLLEELIDRIKDDGVGALHVTYASSLSARARVLRRARLLCPPLNWLANARRRRPLRTPMMQMNIYDLGEVIEMVQRQSRATDLHVELTEHAPFLGAFLLFRKVG